MTVNLAIIGIGRIGKIHANSIFTHPNAKLVGFFDENNSEIKNFSKKYNSDFLDIKTIENDHNIDAVVICSPTDTHIDLIKKFSNSGKAIFCEKPIDLNVNKTIECIDFLNKNKSQFMIGFNRRFDIHFKALKQHILEGKIGNIETVNIISRDPEPPTKDYISRSGGIFKDMTIHDFDMAIFLLGELPNRVFASGSNLFHKDIQDEYDFDTASIILSTESGKQITINNSRRASYGYDQRIEVHGSLGMISSENQRPLSLEIASKEGFTKQPLHYFFMTRYKEAYNEEMKYFIRALKNKEDLHPNENDALNALIIAETAMKSANLNKSVNIEYHN
tara:strand:- start:10 stop:1011 length:1002 start_codon:yes stop_codon:yes gene_type:complete